MARLAALDAARNMTMAPDDLFDRALQEHLDVAEACRRQLRAPFQAMLQAWAGTIRGGGKIMFFGNGGSASDAQHLAAELSVRFQKDRRALAAMALGAETAALTACANDLGYERVFARLIEALGRPGDLAVAISTSGRSPNILRGLEAARAAGIATAGFTGGDGGLMPPLADYLLVVPSTVTARIQEMHITLGQMLCAALERELGLA